MFELEENRVEMLKKIEELFRQKRYAALRELLSPLEAADIAALFADMDEHQVPLLFRLLPKELAAEVFVELDSDTQRGGADVVLRAGRTVINNFLGAFNEHGDNLNLDLTGADIKFVDGRF